MSGDPVPDNLERLSVASRSIREAMAIRDHLIRCASQEGATLRQIGEAAGMTPEGVRRVLARSV